MFVEVVDEEDSDKEEADVEVEIDTKVDVKTDQKTNIHYDTLVDLNKATLFKKLDLVRKVQTTYMANDLIDVVSESPARDKRMINNYLDDEIMNRRIECKGYLRITRFFTMKGIARYVLEGKLFNYKNVCEYFKIPVIDLNKKKLKEELVSMQLEDAYDVKKVLKWLFEKRKSVKSLGEYAGILDIYKWLDTIGTEEKNMISNDKLQLVEELCIE